MTAPEVDRRAASVDAVAWHVPLSVDNLTLGQAYESLQRVGLRQGHIPFVVQLVENPRFDLPLVDVFPGATDLRQHDYIHIVLGRGLHAMDEAFVLGFTMGSTNRMSSVEQRLYEFFARYLYPRAYRFGEQEVEVYRDAVRLGYVSDCESLANIDFPAMEALTLHEVRQRIGLEVDLLLAYYAIEERRYPHSEASRRLCKR
jgi:hypothetical protein